MAGRGQPRRGGHRRVYSQNFLASSALAARLVAEVNVEPGDFVVEIGAGSGMLTAELARRTAPLLPPAAHESFADFVHSLFAGTLANGLNARQWAAIYSAYETAKQAK